MPRTDEITIKILGREVKVGLYGNSKVRPPQIRVIDVDNDPEETISEMLAYITGREITSLEIEGHKVEGREAEVAFLKLREIIEKKITENTPELDPEVAKNLNT